MWVQCPLTRGQRDLTHCGVLLRLSQMLLGAREPHSSSRSEAQDVSQTHSPTFPFFLWTGQTQLLSLQLFLGIPPLMPCAVVRLGLWNPELLFAGVPNVVCFPDLNSGNHGI